MTLNTAIIGCGSIALSAHAPAYTRNADSRLVAVVDPDLDRASALAHRFDVPHVFTSLQDLFATVDVDAVSICTPPHLHARQTVTALEAGCHVLCEKPAALNAGEVSLMAARAAAHDRVLTFGFHYRHLAEARIAAELAGRGDLGEIYAVEATAMRRCGIPHWGVHLDRTKAGGGPLIDIGVHVLDLALWLTGFPEVDKVLGVTHDQLLRGRGRATDSVEEPPSVEDMATGLIRCANGMSLQIRTSFAAHMAQAESTQVRMLGSAAGLEAFPLRLYGREGSLPVRTASAPPHRPWDHQAAYQQQADSFVDACLGRGPLAVTPEQAVHVQDVVDRLYRSAFENSAQSTLAAQARRHDPDRSLVAQ